MARTGVPERSVRRLLRISGAALICAALLLNEWSLAIWLSPDGGFEAETSRLLRAFDAGTVTLGLFLTILGRFVSVLRPARMYRVVCIVLSNTVIFLFVLNLLVAVLWQDAENERFYLEWHERYAMDLESKSGPYGSRPYVEIQELMQTPSNQAHPTLEFMESPVTSKYYNVGAENMRYTRHVNSSNARQELNDSVWMLGGSTGFGHGVADDETIAAYLNDLDERRKYLNFSVQGAHQNLEIDKLLLLLKKGYRPEVVIFLDGLNDISAMRASQFHPAETPMWRYDAYGYLSNFEQLQRPPWEFALRRLPLFDLVLGALDATCDSGTESDEAGHYEDVYAVGNRYHLDPVLHYRCATRQANEYENLVERLPAYQAKLMDYYAINDRFLARLAEAFDFEYHVFFQPIGPLNLLNPFLKNPQAHAESPLYRFFEQMTASVRAGIRSGELSRFHDLSDADFGCRDCYVDLTHYSPQFSKLLAERILSELQRAGR
jgi:hypothetical protein